MKSSKNKYVVTNQATKDGEEFVIDKDNLNYYPDSWVYFRGSKKECLNFIKNN